MNRLPLLARLLVLTAIFIAALPNPSSAGDGDDSLRADQKKAEPIIRDWLSLVDKAKYAESFAAASEIFRRNSTVEQWTAEHRKMLEANGPVVARGNIDNFMVLPLDKTAPRSYYEVTFKTKFEKRSAVEEVQIFKDNDEWKVTSYKIAPAK